MHKLLFSLIFLFLLPAQVFSAEIAGISFPETVKVDNTDLQLNGLGLRKATFLGIKVYAAALYLEQKSSDADAIVNSTSKKRLVLNFVRDVGADKVKGGWNTGFESNNSDLASIAPKIAKFNSYMSDMKSGQRMIFDFLPGRVVAKVASTSFEIEGDDFSKSLLKIWLGNKPPNKALKKGLLGS